MGTMSQLVRVEQDQAYVRLVSDHLTAELSPRDLRLVTMLVAGVTRWRRYLDFLVSHYYHGDMDKLEPAVLQVLRMGVYELVKMRTPPHAVSSEYVSLTKRTVRIQAASLVNAVLRAVDVQQLPDPMPAALDEHGATSPGAAPTRAAIRALSTLHSHPTWLVRRWVKELGWAEAKTLLVANNAEPCYAVRASAGRQMNATRLAQTLAQLHVAAQVSPLLPAEFVRLPDGLQGVVGTALLSDGCCAVQDEAAGLVVALLDPQPGDSVADVCAAPGGKALFTAARLRGQGRVTAVDVSEGRLRALETAAAAQGVDAVVCTVAADSRQWARDEARAATFDRVLVDAPCAGLGVLAKRADLRWRRSLSDLVQLTALQDELLAAAAQLVRPGGLLVYSTCSIAGEENEQRVEAFLATHADFVAEAAPAGLLPDAVLSSAGQLRTWPHRHHVDGSFAARLRRVECVSEPTH